MTDCDSTSEFPDVSRPGAGGYRKRSLPFPEVEGYEITRELAEGGMGVIYLAQQNTPVKRQVVLKVVKPGMDSKQILRRFEAERQVLAMMDHPGIARVFDAGITKNGRSFFVMEYIEGKSITEYCDEHRLTVEKRLRLFHDVCEAIQFAHQKGIIHRDLKPSNILVAEVGECAVPKIIDFGIAKALAQPFAERTLLTEQGQLIGTPEYMSPEQAGMTQEHVDTRSDVYSLGVLLYELLTGRLPFGREEFQMAALAEILRIIQEQVPPHPSAHLSSLGEEAKIVAEKRSTKLVTLIKRLHNELEWIPLKAMRKEPDRRYRTASEFANDIQNYLSDAPLIAGPESVVYRAKKFVQRRRALVAGIATVLVVLIGGILVSTIFAIGQARARADADRQRQIAEQERDLAEQARGNEATARAEAQGAKKIAQDQRQVAEKERDRAREAEQLAEQRQIEAERESQISKAVNDFINKDLFSSSVLIKNYKREVTVREVLDAASVNIKGKFREAPLVEASIRRTMGNVYTALGRYTEAEEHLRRFKDLYQEQFGDWDRQTRSSICHLAWLYLLMNRYDEAETLFKSVLELKCWSNDDPSILYIRSLLGHMYGVMERYEDAELAFGEVEDSIESLQVVSDPKVFQSMSLLAFWHGSRDHYNEAKQLFDRLLKISPKLSSKRDGAEEGIQKALAILLSQCPDDQVRDGKQAVELASDLCEQTNWTDHQCIQILAAAYAEIGDFETAIKWENTAIGLMPEATDPEVRTSRHEWLKQYESHEPLRFEPGYFKLVGFSSEIIEAELNPDDAQIDELNKAVDSNAPNKVKELLDSNADVNARNVLGMAPLHIAAQNGYIEMADLLVSHGAEINMRTPDDETPLYIAARKNYTALAEFLLAEGADPNTATAKGMVPIHGAAHQGNLEMAMLLLKNGTNVDAGLDQGGTPLYVAAGEGHTSLVRAFLQNGADANARNVADQTPLHIASQNGHLEIAKMLLGHGADFNAKAKSGSSPLHMAAGNGHAEVVRMLSEEGADVNAKDGDDFTPLHWAAQQGHPEVVEVLLAHRADVNARSDSGHTSLHCAAKEGHAEVAKTLLARGADVSTENESGRTGLHLAAGQGHVEVAEVLLENGADVNAQDNQGWTSLHLAAFRDKLSISELLVNKKASVDARNFNGFTPLHTAAANGRMRLAAFLIANKADVDARCDSDITPLYYAIHKGHEEMVRLLIEKGADVTVEFKGQTLLNLAHSGGHADIVKLLTKAFESHLSAWVSEGMPIPRSEVLEYYEKVTPENAKFQFRLIDIRPSELRSSDINSSEGETREEAACRIAIQLIERAAKGEDFGELAKTYSHGHRRSYGGLWNPLQPSSLAPLYDVLGEYALDMQPGQVSEPIQKEEHVFIMKLEQAQRESVQPFEEVKDILKEELRTLKRKKLEEAINSQQP